LIEFIRHQDPALGRRQNAVWLSYSCRNATANTKEKLGDEPVGQAKRVNESSVRHDRAFVTLNHR
jgi:hypothetical protein